MGNALINGKSFSESLASGFKSGLSGALIGGAIGGVSGAVRGAIHRHKLKKAFEKLSQEVDGKGLTKDINGKIVASQENLEKFEEIYFSEYKYRDGYRELRYRRSGGKNVYGWTGKRKGKLTVEIYSIAFESDFELFLSIGHEYVHLANIVEGRVLVGQIDKFDEFATYMWEKEVYHAVGDKAWSYDRYLNARDWFDHKLTQNIDIYNNIVKPNYMNFSDWGLPTKCPF